MVPGELFESGSRRFAYNERPLRVGGADEFDMTIAENEDLMLLKVSAYSTRLYIVKSALNLFERALSNRRR
jgi:hypothetical protein